MIKTAIILFCMLILSISACKQEGYCTHKETFLMDYHTFMDSVGQLPNKNTEEWKENDKRFNEYIKDCYEHMKTKMSIEERKSIAEEVLKYYALRVNASIDNNGDSTLVKDVISDDVLLRVKEIESEIEGYYNENLKDDLKNMMDDLSKDLKNLEEMLNERKEIYDNTK